MRRALYPAWVVLIRPARLLSASWERGKPGKVGDSSGAQAADAAQRRSASGTPWVDGSDCRLIRPIRLDIHGASLTDRWTEYRTATYGWTR